jgi:hypothetical protein
MDAGWEVPRVLNQLKRISGAGILLARQLAQKLALVHAVFEGFMSVNKNDRDLVVELAAKFGIRVYVDFFPGESPPASELCEALFHQFAEMTTFARVNHDLTEEFHGWIVAFGNR